MAVVGKAMKWQVVQSMNDEGKRSRASPVSREDRRAPLGGLRLHRSAGQAMGVDDNDVLVSMYTPTV